MRAPPIGAMCRRCEKRRASMWWSTEGMIAAIHGMLEPSCKTCALERQIEHAEKLAGTLPTLREELACRLAFEREHGHD